MVHFTQLFTLATLGSSMVSAIHINFRRYHDLSCNQNEFIRKETDMHDGTCKTFSHNELAFNSYKFKITKDHKDAEKKDCKVIAYNDRNCEGESHTFGDLNAFNDKCAILPEKFNGRSVRFECKKKEVETVTIPKTSSKPTPQRKLVTTTEKASTVTEKPTVIVTSPQTVTKQEEKTLTLVPKQHTQHVHCSYDDDDWKEV